MLIIIKNMIINLDNIRTIDKITVEEEFGLKFDMDETYVDYFFKDEYQRELAFLSIIKCQTDKSECCHLDSEFLRDLMKMHLNEISQDFIEE